MTILKKTVYEYSRFQTKHGIVNHPDIQGILFCTKALSPGRGEKRPHMLNLCVKGNFITGTNGSVLHEYRLQHSNTLPNGLYRPIVKRKTCVVLCQEGTDSEYEYPKWKHLFPNKTQLKGAEEILINPCSFDGTIFKINNAVHSPININFIKNLEDYMKLYIPIKPKNKDMFYFESNTGDKRAIIMAMSA